MRISNIKNQRANTAEKCFHSINTAFFAPEAEPEEERRRADICAA